VWNFFLTNYNGGPEICLKKNDDIFVSLSSCTQTDHIPYSEFKDCEESKDRDESEEKSNEEAEEINDLNNVNNDDVILMSTNELKTTKLENTHNPSIKLKGLISDKMIQNNKIHLKANNLSKYK